MLLVPIKMDHLFTPRADAHSYNMATNSFFECSYESQCGFG